MQRPYTGSVSGAEGVDAGEIVTGFRSFNPESPARPHAAELVELELAAAQLREAEIEYAQIVATPTTAPEAPATPTRTPTPTSTTTPTATATATGQPTAPGRQVDVSRIYAKVDGVVSDVQIVGIAGNEMTIEISIYTGPYADIWQPAVFQENNLSQTQQGRVQRLQLARIALHHPVGIT